MNFHIIEICTSIVRITSFIDSRRHVDTYHHDLYRLGQSEMFDCILKILDNCSEVRNFKIHEAVVVFSDLYLKIRPQSTLNAMQSGDLSVYKTVTAEDGLSIEYLTEVMLIQNIVQVLHACEVDVKQVYLREELLASYLSEDLASKKYTHLAIDFAQFDTKLYLCHKGVVYRYDVLRHFSVSNLCNEFSEKFGINYKLVTDFISLFFNKSEIDKMKTIHSQNDIEQNMINILARYDSKCMDDFCKNYIQNLFESAVNSIDVDIDKMRFCSDVQSLHFMHDYDGIGVEYFSTDLMSRYLFTKSTQSAQNNKKSLVDFIKTLFKLNYGFKKYGLKVQ